MSDAGATTEPTVTEDDITVTKAYEAEEFPVPAVAFRFTSEREDGAIVRLTDSVPGSVPPEDLGFHPDYGSDHWSVEDGDAVFERRLDPGEEYQTVYGIRSTDTDPEEFMTQPALDVDGLGDTEAESAAGTDETVGGDSSQAARDVITGKSVAGLDDDESVEDVDLSGSGTDGTTDGTTTGEGKSENATGTDTAIPAGGAGAALAAEIREGDLDEDDRELLAAELDVKDAGSEVRLTHLQSRISDLEAYTDALEEFIDENGPARQLIEDMSSQLETIEDDLKDLDGRTTENEADIAALDDRTAKNAGDIDALDKGVADVKSEIDATQDEIEELRGEIEGINDWRTQISTVLGGPPGGSETGDGASDGDESDGDDQS